MKLEIVFPAPLWIRLQNHLFGASDSPMDARDEQLAFLLAGPNASPSRTRLVVRDLLFAQADDLTEQSPGGIAPTGEFVAMALTRCRQEGWSLIEVHSHPFSDGSSTTFSGIDWENDQAKMPDIARILPRQSIHATMVIGQRSLDAHYYDRASASIEPVDRVVICGANMNGGLLSYISPTLSAKQSLHPFLVEDRHSRQILLFGHDAQATLADSAIVIVGLGGLGSFVALECAHLGVGELLLIDPDRVEASNLNRLVGTTEIDIGKPKVEVYASQIRAISAQIEVTTIAEPILSDEGIRAVKEADILLGCVDNDGARLVMNQLAVQYGIPLIDAGAGARVDDQRHLTDAGGQVQIVLPGLGCLECRGFINATQAAFDLAPPHIQQRERAHGYGTDEPAPAVVYLNGVVASLQVAETVQLLVAAMRRTQNRQPETVTLYDLTKQSLMRAIANGRSTCPTCGTDGITGLADLSPLETTHTLPSSPDHATVLDN